MLLYFFLRNFLSAIFTTWALNESEAGRGLLFLSAATLFVLLYLVLFELIQLTLFVCSLLFVFCNCYPFTVQYITVNAYTPDWVILLRGFWYGPPWLLSLMKDVIPIQNDSGLILYKYNTNIHPPLSRESDQSAITSSLRSCRPPAYHSKMGRSRWVLFPKPQQVNLPVCSAHCPFNAERQTRKLWILHCKKFWVIALPNFGQMYALPKKNGQKPNFFWVW